MYRRCSRARQAPAPRTHHLLGAFMLEPAPALLLQGRGHERRPGAFEAARLLLPTLADGERLAVQASRARSARLGFVDRDGFALQLAVLVEVPAERDLLALERAERRLERRLRRVLRDDVPVGSGVEPHARALALDDEPQRRALHTAGGQPGLHLAPQHGRDFAWPVEAVERAARLLRVDAACVHDVARSGRRRRRSRS